ncbi:helix-turn-helix domain-containing protein (plasmid) [Burkholderia sp. FERM BP-3421]|uniref:helix-turn-helix domain-containing protein n=1 Tax=Burkholderia sp. FERM BP-3421 TaxID=1494466 RepID=UPI00236271E5|nr:helix-turn-helix domain-containing protein [Burkholderia sp. FERM BP-3421]WDD90719.1 helix-turn-helix domain-containing protein [Burkholderia sp. FERM BP-3421]
MQCLQPFAFALMSTGERRHDMRRFAGSCSFVYNTVLASPTKNREAGDEFIDCVTTV